MADYEKMYNALRIEGTIKELKASLLEAEKIYISTDENNKFSEKDICQNERDNK